MRDKRYIRKEFIPRMHELRIKADEYWVKHREEERDIWNGKYEHYMGGHQQVLVNGLSESEKEELYINGVMPFKEHFDMW